MNHWKYLEEMKMIQINLLEFIGDSMNAEEKYQNFIKLLKDYQILLNKHKLKSLLHLITKISNNHYRPPNFFSKIEKVLSLLQEKMALYLSNLEIFNIFKSNKRLLLYLIKENIIIFDHSNSLILKRDKYIEYGYVDYFFNETKELIKRKKAKKISNELSENYEEKRNIGENDNPICEIIRKDSVDDFIRFVQLNNVQLDSTIEYSIFETNSFLLKNEPLLIEYAAFFWINKHC